MGARQLRNMIRAQAARGIVKGVLLSGKALRITDDRFPTGVEVLQPYGLSYVPQAGAEHLVLQMDGDRQHRLVIQCGDRRYRLSVQQGEVALHDDQQQKVHLRRDGILVETSRPAGVTVKATGGPIHLDAQSVVGGPGEGGAMVLWSQLQAFLQGMVLPVNLVAATAGPPPVVPSMGTTALKGV